MKITFLGHAAFSLETRSGSRILIDPYESGGFSGRVGYAPITGHHDLVVITHDHLDHNHTDSLVKPFEIIRHRGSFADVEVDSVSAFHDEFKGQRFGGTIDMKVIEFDGLRLCHAGDLGQILEQRHIEALGSLDLLILPVGGFYTLDGAKAARVCRQLKPQIVIPCHYKTPQCGFEISGRAPFVSHFEWVVEPQASSVELFAKSGLLAEAKAAQESCCLLLEPAL